MCAGAYTNTKTMYTNTNTMYTNTNTMYTNTNIMYTNIMLAPDGPKGTRIQAM